jgi:hypothetical protein
MLLPLAVIIAAVLLAGIVAYGCESSFGSMGTHGIDMILWSRRLQWPLGMTAILLCLVLAALVVSGKRRLWWLLGLLPVLALFTHHFVTNPALRFYSIDDPELIPASQVTFLADADQVVGITRNGTDCAFPYSVLYHDPVVVQSDRAGTMVLFWSPHANRALAFNATRDLRARDLDIVSSPANTLIVFNSRLGQFINGVTGRICGKDEVVPTGLRDLLPVHKMSWANWRSLHPQTMVMAPPNVDWKNSPNQPIAPQYPMPGCAPALPDARRVCFVATTQPLVIPSEGVTDQPLNLRVGQSEVLLVRINGRIAAFDRQLPLDLVPRFSQTTDAKHKTAVWLDTDSNSEWSPTGEVVQGPPEMQHVKLSSIPVEDDVYLGIMKYWYPDLHIVTADEITAARVVKPGPATKSTGIKRRKKPRT